MSESNFCYYCRFYKPYYTKGYIKFDKLDTGLCCKSRETVDKHYCCENFCRQSHVRIDKKAAALSKICENINILSEIKQILEEDDNQEEFLKDLLKRINAQKKIL